MSNEPPSERVAGDRNDGVDHAPPSDGPPASVGFGEGETWFDAIEDLLDATIERDEEFVCTFDSFAVDVPLRMGEESPHARWRLDGTVAVSVEGTRGPLAAWLEWWSRRAA
ncbi:MAG: hypothetical protein ABEH78_10245 [Haloferacaceae archaeon]